MCDYLEESLLVSCSQWESEPSGNFGSVTIFDLPYEVLDNIFSFLTIKERIRTEWVCRRWADFGKNCKWSWPTKLNLKILSLDNEDEKDNVWSSVLSRCGSSVKKIEIVFYRSFFGPTLSTCYMIGANCLNLTNILLVNLVNGDTHALTSITTGCTKLKMISIHVLSYERERVFLNLKNCQSLEYLELISNGNVIDKGCLDTIKVPLKGFKLRTNVPDIAHWVKMLLRRNDPLEELAFSCLIPCSVKWLVKVCQQYENTLRKLILPACTMNSSKWNEIVAPLKHLEVLLLKFSARIDNSFILVLADSCRNLRKLDITGSAITDIGVSFLRALPDLTVLSLNETNISGEGILSLSACGRLEILYFADIKYYNILIEPACMALATNCPNLKLLDLHDNVNITHQLESQFRSCIQRGELKGPVSLYLSPHLKKQDLEACKNLKVFYEDHYQCIVELNSEAWE